MGWRLHRHGPAQKSVDVASGLFPMAGRSAHGLLTRDHISSGEQTWMTGHHALVDVDRTVVQQPNARQVPQETCIDLLAQRENHGVCLDRVEPSGGLRPAVLVQFHDFHGQLCLVGFRDAAQPVEAHSLFSCFGNFLLERGSVRFIPAIDDHRLDSQSLGRPSHVDRGIASTIDSHSPPEFEGGRTFHAAQKCRGIEHPPGIAPGNVDAPREVGTDREERRMEPALLDSRIEILNACIEPDRDAHRFDSRDLPIDNVAWQSIGRNPITHHAADLVTRFMDRDGVAHPRQMIGS